LLDLLSRCKAVEGKGPGKVGCYHLDSFPALEFRIGGFKKDGLVKQVQSACPPTVTDGVNRTWEGPENIATLPETAYAVLGEIAKGLATVEAPRSAWFRKALEEEASAVASTPEGERRNRLRDACYTLGGQIHHGYLSEEEVRQAMETAGTKCGLREQEIARTIEDGLTDGKANPLPWPARLERQNGNGRPHARTTHTKSSTEKSKPSKTRRDRFGNFTARIVQEIVRHESLEVTRQVVIEAIHDDKTVATATVATKDFDCMSWVSSQLGLKFAIFPGQGMKDEFQFWIKENSYPGVEVREIYTALGWHTIGDKDVYLDVGGGIGESGKLNIEVDVKPELALYRLPTPDLTRLREGVERVVAILNNLGPEAERVASIIISLPYRALLGPTRAVPHFYGTSGTYKTSVACLALRFFAPALEWDATMPLTWETTPAAAESIRYSAKDSLLPIDNFIADGEQAQAQREWTKINNVLNSQGDLVGKGRANPDGSPIPRKDPRGSLMSTGECEPRRKSALGRSIIEEVKPGLIDFPGLKRCHDDARDGWYALTIACYAQYLASPGGLEAHRTELRRLTEQYKDIAATRYAGCHKRHAEAIAEWTAAWELFLHFAVERTAITKQCAKLYLDRVRDGLFKALPIQADIQEEADFGDTFRELLRSLLAMKKVVLMGMDGNPPPNDIADACGWEQAQELYRGEQGYDHSIRSFWRQAPGATKVGWVDDRMVYLDPNESHAAVERRARDLGKTLGTPRQVTARLAETGRIVFDKQTTGRQRYTKRVSVGKQRLWLLWMPRNELLSLEE
jgi:hypothetical protein